MVQPDHGAGLWAIAGTVRHADVHGAIREIPDATGGATDLGVVVRNARPVAPGDCYAALRAYGDWDQRVADYIVNRESGGNPGAVSATNDHGCFQLNAIHAHRVGGDVSLFHDAAINARVAHDLWLDQGWVPWRVQ